jgi:hypothetical protein
MGKTSRAVIRGSRLFNTIFGLPRTGKKYHKMLEGCSKAAPLQFLWLLEALNGENLNIT